MTSIENIKMYITHPRRLLIRIGSDTFLKWMSDEKYLKLLFRDRMGYELNLENPKTFSEKLQWLKIHDRKSEYTDMVDKYEAKKYVADRIGEKYIIPTLGVWDSFEEIDFSKLPNQFVLKCTHDSGGLCICTDKAKFNKKAARKKLNRSLKRNYFWSGREWPYKNVKPRIIAEKYMVDESRKELKDYKVLCFNGEPKLIEIHSGRFGEKHTQDFYDAVTWERTDIQQYGTPMAEHVMKKPCFAEEMNRLSSLLSEGISHVRVDWYYVEGQLYFGELTFYDGSGVDPFIDKEFDLLLGSYIKI